MEYNFSVVIPDDEYGEDSQYELFEPYEEESDGNEIVESANNNIPGILSETKSSSSYKQELLSNSVTKPYEEESDGNEIVESANNNIPDISSETNSSTSYRQEILSNPVIESESESEAGTSGSEYQPTNDTDDESSIASESTDDLDDDEISSEPSKLQNAREHNNVIEEENLIEARELESSFDDVSISTKHQNLSSHNLSNSTNDPNKTQVLNVSAISGTSSLENSFGNININSVGEALKNKNVNFVPNSSSGTKQNCCFYCVEKSLAEKNTYIKTHKSKLAEHYARVHYKEKPVAKLNKLQEKLEKLKKKPEHNTTEEQKEIRAKRKEILDMLRIKANHLNNLNTDDVTKYVVRRRPHKNGKLLSEYLPCLKCTQVYSISSLRKHVRKCTGRSFKKKHEVKSMARATNGDYHKDATEAAIKIICKMRETEAMEEIRYDTATFIWLNAESSRCEAKLQQHPKIRASLSRLGTLLREMKKLNPNIEELADVFDENFYEDLIKAIRVMGKPNPNTKYLQSPATANDMFNLLQHVSQVYEVTLGSKNETMRTRVQNFLRRLKTMWNYSIGATIAETQARNRRNKAIDLPDESDNRLLHEYLKKQMADSYESLEEKFSDLQYEKLRDSSVCYLQSTNARRPGEVERLEVSDYEHIKCVENDCVIVVRGKRGRGVPIVFYSSEKKYLDMLKDCRDQAGICKENPYFFATIHDVGTQDYSHVSACKLMGKFALDCQAEKPETLRGTRIRMAVATNGLKKGLKPGKVNELADYLGHTPQIHNQNYRQSVMDINIAVSRQVREAQGLINNEENQNGSNVQQDLVEDYYEDLPSTSYSNHEEENYEQISESDKMPFEPNRFVALANPIAKQSHVINIKNKDTGPLSTVKSRPARLPWKKKEIGVLLQHFPNALDLKSKVPSVNAINKFIQETNDPVLRMRTEPQIRSWFHLKRKSMKSDQDLPERDRIPAYIYHEFKKYIDAGKLPPFKKCAKLLSSPSKANVTMNNIQQWVKLAIQKRSKLVSANATD